MDNKLVLGKMTSKQLADWFNVSYNSYKNDISRYLDTLEGYCDFDKVYGGVIVKEIFIEVYDKSQNMNDIKLYTEEIQRCVEEQEGLSTFSGMVHKFKHENIVDIEKDDKTYSRRFSKVAKQMFGEIVGLNGIGPKGSREYVWAIRVSKYNNYRFMTPEEEKRFDEIISNCYSTSAEKIKKKQLLEEALFYGEIELDEFFETQERLGLNLFKDCIYQFKMETGLTIVRCQKHELISSAF